MFNIFVNRLSLLCVPRAIKIQANRIQPQWCQRKENSAFQTQAFTGSEVGGRRPVMERKGMFSFTREENDPQTGREKYTELDKKGKSNRLCTKPKYWISVAEEHFFFDSMQKKHK